MKIIDCPHLGPRPLTEFAISGILDPEPENLGEFTPGRWAFERNSVPLERVEWWFHIPSELWFLVRRETASNTIVEVKAAHD
ncbi:MAG: sarcosine oxidase subunit delta [Gammaproteobacteria bacterium]